MGLPAAPMLLLPSKKSMARGKRLPKSQVMTPKIINGELHTSIDYIRIAPIVDHWRLGKQLPQQFMVRMLDNIPPAGTKVVVIADNNEDIRVSELRGNIAELNDKGTATFADLRFMEKSGRKFYFDLRIQIYAERMIEAHLPKAIRITSDGPRAPRQRRKKPSDPDTARSVASGSGTTSGSSSSNEDFMPNEDGNMNSLPNFMLGPMAYNSLWGEAVGPGNSYRACSSSAAGKDSNNLTRATSMPAIFGVPLVDTALLSPSQPRLLSRAQSSGSLSTSVAKRKYESATASQASTWAKPALKRRRTAAAGRVEIEKLQQTSQAAARMATMTFDEFRCTPMSHLSIDSLPSSASSSYAVTPTAPPAGDFEYNLFDLPPDMTLGFDMGSMRTAVSAT